MHTVRIWDAPTRVFHWALVGCFAGLIITGKTGGNAMEWHFRLGYLTASLLLFRLIWGVIGGKWSRFSSFQLSPRAVTDHLHGRKRVASVPGHNPLGALSILAMLMFLLVQVGTGLITEDIGGETFGPLSGLVSRAAVKLASGYHKEVGSTLLLVLTALHLLAVTMYLVRKKENLIKPMLTGDKILITPVTPSRDDVRSRATATVILILCAALIMFVVKLGN
jgi:cytochrome b